MIISNSIESARLIISDDMVSIRLRNSIKLPVEIIEIRIVIVL